MERASIFKSNKSQAVRLPKTVALPDSVKQVDIVKLGRARLITPAGEAWDSWFEGEGVSEDFMPTREQPEVQDRESFRMLLYLLDTNILIYTMKNKPASVREAFNAHYGKMCISSVSLMELIYGAEKSAQRDRNLKEVEGLAARLEVLPYDTEAAIHSGQIRVELARVGTPIGPYDLMIAGHARSRSVILVSNNTNEFGRVAGLRVENWVL